MSDIADFLIVVLTGVIVADCIVIGLVLMNLLSLVQTLALRPPVTVEVERPAPREPEQVSDTVRAEVVDAATLAILAEAMAPPETVTLDSAVVDPTDGIVPRLNVDWTPDQSEQLPAEQVPDPTDGSV